jgi:hypothetical protein
VALQKAAQPVLASVERPGARTDFGGKHDLGERGHLRAQQVHATFAPRNHTVEQQLLLGIAQHGRRSAGGARVTRMQTVLQR